MNDTATARYEADQATMFLAADGSMMCEKHPGYEWTDCPGGAGCPGPGTPWVLSGRTVIEETLREHAAKRGAEPTPVQALIEKWRKEADGVERELQTIRREHPEGPRYGISAVRECADELEAALASVPAAVPEQDDEIWSERDQDKLIALFNDPPPANEALKRALTSRALPAPPPAQETPMTVEQFRDEVRDKLYVAVATERTENLPRYAIVIRQCEDFLVERYQEALEAPAPLPAQPTEGAK